MMPFLETPQEQRELLRMRSTLDRIIAGLGSADQPPVARGDSPRPAVDPAAHRGLARSLYRARRRRAGVFPEASALFAEPAWDMMLDLYLARIEGRQVSVGSASIAADVPATTALRWIAKLELMGLVERSSDPLDARRSYIAMTDATVERMRDYLAQIA